MQAEAKYTDRYADYLAKLQRQVSSGQKGEYRPLVGFCSNADVVLSWDAAVYNQILKRYLHTEPDQGRNEQIASMEDFARISSWYITHGIGGNMDISNVQVCDELLACFASEPALGGTGAQAAAALGAVGIPADVHLTDRSKPVCAMLSGRGIMTADHGERIAVENCRSESVPIYHFILQFQKDDIIEIDGKKIRIPCSNRLILFFDSVHRLLPIAEDDCGCYERESQNLTSYLLSGFDAVVDVAVIEARLELLSRHITRLRQSNPRMVFYLEGAFYLNPAVKTRVMCQLGPLVDIVGMNEEELAEAVADFGQKIDLDDAQQVIGGLALYLTRFHLRGIVLHTKDYALYYGKPLAGIDLEQGLTLGNLMAATRARTGRYGNLHDCAQTLALPLSARGQSFAEQFMQLDGQLEDRVLTAVPSRYMEHPRYTIGLGDTFTAGMQISFWSARIAAL